MSQLRPAFRTIGLAVLLLTSACEDVRPPFYCEDGRRWVAECQRRSHWLDREDRFWYFFMEPCVPAPSEVQLEIYRARYDELVGIDWSVRDVSYQCEEARDTMHAEWDTGVLAP